MSVSIENEYEQKTRISLHKIKADDFGGMKFASCYFFHPGPSQF